jgi:cardiolipin synthase
VPNLIGYARLAAIPLFLYLAFESGDGRTAGAAIVFWLIAAGDYVDGFLARVTGQYSRLGALMDPFIDRLTILAGAVVCWHFELLPRWALAVLVARELVMLGLAQYAVRHGVELRVNWPGRISVFPIMGGIFFALVVDGWVPEALLITGVALAIVATAMYARDGLVEAGRLRAGSP